MPVRTWSYPQVALVLNFGHQRDHEGISTEFHTPTGPFTQVPLPGRRSSLVWVETPDEAIRLKDLPVEQLSREVERRLHSILGAVEVEEPIQSFPSREHRSPPVRPALRACRRGGPCVSADRRAGS